MGAMNGSNNGGLSFKKLMGSKGPSNSALPQHGGSDDSLSRSASDSSVSNPNAKPSLPGTPQPNHGYIFGSFCQRFPSSYAMCWSISGLLTVRRAESDRTPPTRVYLTRKWRGCMPTRKRKLTLKKKTTHSTAAKSTKASCSPFWVPAGHSTRLKVATISPFDFHLIPFANGSLF